jgi:hypothetical protein
MNCPRYAESLCKRVRSTPKEEAFSGMVTSLPPAEGVNETELTATAKERIEVLGGGVNGSAAKVRFNEPLPPPPPQLVVQGFFTPLQEESERLAAIAAKTRHFLGFMQTPHDGFHRHH